MELHPPQIFIPRGGCVLTPLAWLIMKLLDEWYRLGLPRINLDSIHILTTLDIIKKHTVNFLVYYLNNYFDIHLLLRDNNINKPDTQKKEDGDDDNDKDNINLKPAGAKTWAELVQIL